VTEKGHGVKKPLVEIDESYVGSFNIKKNMKVTAGKESKSSDTKDWLSCCFGGYGAIDDGKKILPSVGFT
jgi:hypothetical protein